MPTDLDPETIEVWAGLRSVASRISALEDEIADLRAELSGFSAYKDFLRSHSSFSGLESDLKQRAADFAGIADSDVGATVGLLEGAFTDYQDYAGDSTAGALAQATYDQYRTYLTNNGIASIDADTHIQLLKDLFDPNATFASDTGTHADWDAFETELENNGVSATSAADTVSLLQVAFTSVQAMDRRVIGASSWSAFDSELESNGLTSSEASDVVADLKTAYGSTLDSTVKDSFSAFDSYNELQTYLENNGFDSSKASTTITKIQSQYADFDAFRTQVLSQDDGLAVLLAAVDQTTSSGGKAGIKVFNKAGTTANGVSVPKDAVAVRGTEVHFVEIGATSSQTASSGSVAYSNITLGDSRIDTTEQTRVTVEVTNTDSSATVSGLTVPLLVDGQVTARNQIQTLVPSQTIGVGFDLVGSDLGYGGYDVQIGDSNTVTLTVSPSQIQS